MGRRSAASISGSPLTLPAAARQRADESGTGPVSQADPGGVPNVGLGMAGLNLDDRVYCPVDRCRAGDRVLHPGWQTMAGLRPHVDAHLLGQLPGRPSQEWMRSINSTACGECGKLVSLRCANGMHRKCFAQRLNTQPPAVVLGTAQPGTLAPPIDGQLPTLDDISSNPCATRDFVGQGLLPQAEREFLLCVANAVHCNRPDAWDYEKVGSPDRTECAASRRAWVELLMFPKTCLPVLPGGKAQQKYYCFET